VATSVTRRGPSAAARAETLVVLVYGFAAVAPAVEAVMHVQQWMRGGHSRPRVRAHARPRGDGRCARSALALGSSVVSYGRRLFGRQEAGFKTPVELAVIFEVAAVVAAALAAAIAGRGHLPTLSCPTKPDPSRKVPRATAVRPEVGP
jgi:hypothetical protein